MLSVRPLVPARLACRQVLIFTLGHHGHTAGPPRIQVTADRGGRSRLTDLLRPNRPGAVPGPSPPGSGVVLAGRATLILHLQRCRSSLNGPRAAEGSA